MWAPFSKPEILRSFVFGVEDSVVSTVGLVSGIAVVGSTRPVILITGVILVFVEAFSMATGDLLSDNAVREMRAKGEMPLAKSLAQALVMFFSYLLSGFLVLSPYVFLVPTRALVVSIIVSLAVLFALGVFGGAVSNIPVIKNGAMMAVIGGIAIVIGMSAGVAIQYLTGMGVI